MSFGSVALTGSAGSAKRHFLVMPEYDGARLVLLRRPNKRLQPTAAGAIVGRRGGNAGALG